MVDTNISPLDAFKNSIINLDPVAFCENNLTLDGQQFRLTNNGYKPFADIYRYIGIKALEPDALPVILVKGRQVGATTMAAALTCYFMASRLFGNNGRPPMRVIHLFPTLGMAAAYSKMKFSQMVGSAKPAPGEFKGNGAPKTYIEKELDTSSPANNNLHFKKFLGDNQLEIESTGPDGNRLRGRTTDCILADECFPASQQIETENGKQSIGSIYSNFVKNKKLSKVKSYNEEKDCFEFKNIVNVWKKNKKELVEIKCGDRKIKCTYNHKFLTENGWIEAQHLKHGTLLKTSEPVYLKTLLSINDDQKQIVLGSFLGNGHIDIQGLHKFRLKIIHGESQKEYCNWKAQMFGASVKYIEKNGYAENPAYKFDTKMFAMSRHFPPIKTHCPQWLLDEIDERGLAVWFMDDGSVSGGNATISTCSFDDESHERIIKMLQRFDIEGIISKYKKIKNGKEKKYTCIKIRSKSYKKLVNLISPYIHDNLLYKIEYYNKNNCKKYNWNNKFYNHGFIIVDYVKNIKTKKVVYDIEVEDNHNFVCASSRKAKGNGGPIAHNCQDIPQIALGAITKTLTKAQYGKSAQGIQVYFGTPKQKGTAYYNMWMKSTQQYYHLKCEECESYFPLYRPDVEWESIWLYGYIVKCTECGHEQDKRVAAESGKWISFRADEEEAKYIGFHINQLYMPDFTREMIDAQRPENNPINTERIYQNEVLGEFYDGEAATITKEEIHEKCSDKRKFARIITRTDNRKVYAGFDWGQRGNLDQLAGRQRGQSYSCAVILTAENKNLFHIQFATKMKSADPGHKIEVVEEMFRRYSINMAVGDIGDAHDLTHILQRKWPDTFLASRAAPNVNGHIKYENEIFPKEIVFERNYYISELIGLLKNGNIKFPYGSYEKVMWLVEHCASMDVKVNINRSGDPIKTYIKGPTPNDGFMALLNAYIAYKFDITQGFQINHPKGLKFDNAKRNKGIPALLSYMPKWK